MKIALIGYGKMGRMIESVALERGHEIVCIVDPAMQGDSKIQEFKDSRIKGFKDLKIDSPEFRSADVAIEFSRPDAAEKNVREAIKQGVAVVSGTTGWNVAALREELAAQEVRNQISDVRCEHPGIIWSSNYSVGVNVLFAVNKYLARLLHRTGGYTPAITEVHHVHKLDAPSGTAVTLAEDISTALPIDRSQKSEVRCQKSDVRCQKSEVSCPIESIREGEVPGIHEVRWESEADILTLRHEAKSRQGFALGAVLAAEWLQGKTGWHDMTEVMGI